MNALVLLPGRPQDPAGRRNSQRVQKGLGEAGFAVKEVSPDPHALWELARGASQEWLWIHYPDVLLPFTAVAERLPSLQYPALKPYSGLYRLSQAESEAGLLEIGDGKPLGGVWGKGSYLLKRELFLALGGLHPRLSLDGNEGYELRRRLSHFFPHIPQIEAAAFQLFRPISPQERELRKESSELRKSLQQEFEKDPKGYLSGFSGFDEKTVQRMVRQEALAVTSPHPPRQIPTTLPGELWGLTTYFNPQGYRTKYDNFQKFRAGLNLPLCVVELGFGDREFELNERDAEKLVQLRGGDVLWQKEQLLNLGLQALPESCDKVVWLDADILFENEQWPNQVAQLLEDYAIVQPFSLSVRLKPGETHCETSELPLGSAEHEVLHGIAYGVAAKGLDSLSSYLRHGHSGYVWAGRREILQKHGFYRANILGNADLNIAQAMFGGSKYLKTDRLSPRGKAHLGNWADAFYGDVLGSVSYLPGTVYHLWHGNKEDRLYHGRLEILIQHDFDPDADLAESPTGPLVWNSHKPDLHRWCEEYFALRSEDPK